MTRTAGQVEITDGAISYLISFATGTSDLSAEWNPVANTGSRIGAALTNGWWRAWAARASDGRQAIVFVAVGSTPSVSGWAFRALPRVVFVAGSALVNFESAGNYFKFAAPQLCFSGDASSASNGALYNLVAPALPLLAQLSVYSGTRNWNSGRAVAGGSPGSDLTAVVNPTDAECWFYTFASSSGDYLWYSHVHPWVYSESAQFRLKTVSSWSTDFAAPEYLIVGFQLL
ncbi:MAG: hypothetical protein HC910_22065 [Spirulinaceae cyanobacterium SM2_1_0]|nr:hypothetical protein [Spirulinaceae cyanobacterium SM2_1_0]